MGYLDDIDEYGWNPQTGQTYGDTMGNVQWDSNGFLASPLSGTFTNSPTGLVNGNLFSNIAKSISGVADSINTGGSTWFGKSGILPTAFQGLSALGGLMQAYTGFKGLQLAKEQLQNSIKAFRTQFEANKTALADQARNASAVNYAAHHGLARSFNQDEQRQVADNEYNRVKNSYKSYI